MKNIGRAAIVFLFLATGCNGCGSGPAPATCAPCGDGAIVCTGTVAACAADNGGTCTTKIGATGAGSLAFKTDGSYTETTADGTQGGSWTQEMVGTGQAVLLHTSAGPTALLSFYPAGACPY